MEISPSAEYAQLAELLPDDFSNPDDSVAEVRAKFEMVHGHDPGDDVTLEVLEIGIWVRANNSAAARRPVVFFVHGGGFVTSPAATYTFYGANIARKCGADVFVAEYRLAPETTFPGPIDDLVACYRSLIDAGTEPATVVFMGDSCGGGMALAALIRLRDEGDPLPAGLVSLCGWFDLEATGESAVNPIGRDPLLNVDWLRLRGRDYVGPDGDPSDPGASPLHAELNDLPPVLLHAGQLDRCRSDAERLTARLIQAGTEAELEIWPGMPHGFHGLVGAIPEADAALGEVNTFIRRHTWDD
ncbi:MAG: alpha/beta hydrolase [Acidobacteria bacterium]|nr:alpha/beta hydrolase [Acidobacteriota bacterium]